MNLYAGGYSNDLSNLFEYKHNLSIMDADSDHDGINDGEEYHYWQERLSEIHADWDNDTINTTALQYCLNPDVDGDNITDGKEIKGYEVKIITGWDANGAPISGKHEIKSDPLAAYRDSNGNWIDCDGDNVPDAVESMLSNATHFMDFYNFTHRQDWMYIYRISLWDDYSWAIAYYFSLKLHRSWDEVYSRINANPAYFIKYYKGENAYNKSCGENATKWLQSQFNPMVRENMPPVILKFNVYFHYYIVTAEVDVHVVVRDAGFVKNVKIVNSDFGESVEWRGEERKVVIDHTFWATPWGANLGVNITVSTKDKLGNEVEMHRDVYGPVGIVIKAFLDWLTPFFKALAEFAKAVMSAVKVVVDWIVGQIRSFLQGLNTMLTSVAMGYLGEVENVFSGRDTFLGTSLYLHANIFGWSITGFELALGIFATVFTGGAWSTTTFAEDLGFIGLEDALSYATAEVIKIIAPLIGLAFGMMLRTYLQKVVDSLDIPQEWKDTILFGINAIVIIGLGHVLTHTIGSDDVKSLVCGYVATILFFLIPYVVKWALPNATSDAINTISAAIRAVILGWMIYLVIKSVFTTSPTDIVAGLIGTIDEIFLGFLLADAIFSASEMAHQYFESLLQYVSSGGG